MEGQSHDAFLAFVFSGLGILLSLGTFAATAVQTLCFPEYARLHSALVTTALASLVASSVALGRELLNCWQRSCILRHLPGPKIPRVQGMAALMQKRMDHHRLLSEWAEEYGPIYRTRFLMFHGVVITDPMLAMQALRSKKCDKLPFQYKLLDPFLGGTNLLTSQTNAHWRATRKGVAPAFSSACLRAAFADAATSAARLAVRLEGSDPGAPYNMENLLLCATMDMIGKFGFGHDLQNIEGMQPSSKHALQGTVAQLLIECSQDVTANFREVLWFARFWRKDVRKSRFHYRAYLNLIKRIFDGCSRDNLSGTFASLLLKIKDPLTGKPLEEKQMIPEMAALFFAGSDTTAHTAAFCLYEISQHPEVEQRIVEELRSLGVEAGGDASEVLTYANLGQLAYLDATIKETLRLYPPVGAGQVRLVNRQLKLSEDLLVPSGCLLWVPHHGVFTSSRNWDRSKEFVPERWLEAGAEYAKTLSFSPEFYSSGTEGGDFVQAADDIDADALASKARRYFPFGEGPRNCVGQNLAKMALPLLLATLLSKFSFKLAHQMGGAEGVRAAEVTSLITGTKEGILMNVHPRKGSQE